MENVNAEEPLLPVEDKRWSMALGLSPSLWYALTRKQLSWGFLEMAGDCCWFAPQLLHSPCGLWQDGLSEN